MRTKKGEIIHISTIPPICQWGYIFKHAGRWLLGVSRKDTKKEMEEIMKGAKFEYEVVPIEMRVLSHPKK